MMSDLVDPLKTLGYRIIHFITFTMKIVLTVCTHTNVYDDTSKISSDYRLSVYHNLWCNAEAAYIIVVLLQHCTTGLTLNFMKCIILYILYIVSNMYIYIWLFQDRSCHTVLPCHNCLCLFCSVYQVFENVSDQYDLMNDAMTAGVHRLWKDIFMEHLNPSPGTRLIDVAGGTGE